MDEMVGRLLFEGLMLGLLVNLGADRLPRWLWPDVRVERGGQKHLRWLGVQALALALVLYTHEVARQGALSLSTSVNLPAPRGDELSIQFFCGLFLLIAVIDLEHRKVPNVLVGVTFLATLLGAWVRTPEIVPGMLIGGATGLTLFAAIAGLRPGAMGGGDVKLAGLIGSVVGFPYVFVALAIGIMAGGLGSLLLLLARRVRLKDS
ncbi:MAG: prepilin peptidase, partial [Caldilineae bacterium]